MIPRKEVAEGLKKAACSYFLHKGYSCHVEIGIERRGRFRADVLAVNLRGQLIICEVKSGTADFLADDRKLKWHAYLPASNKFYFVFDEPTTRLLEPHFARLKESGCGVLTLCSKTGYLRSTIPARTRSMQGQVKREVITRLAWRSGDVSKRNSRRVRVYLKDYNDKSI